MSTMSSGIGSMKDGSSSGGGGGMTGAGRGAGGVAVNGAALAGWVRAAMLASTARLSARSLRAVLG
jgi:hypothetical protein